MNDSSPRFVSSIVGWMQHPFQTQGNVLNWFLFVGLLMVAAILWTRVLGDIAKATREL